MLIGCYGCLIGRIVLKVYCVKFDRMLWCMDRAIRCNEWGVLIWCIMACW